MNKLPSGYLSRRTDCDMLINVKFNDVACEVQFSQGLGNEAPLAYYRSGLEKGEVGRDVSCFGAIY